MFDPAAVNHISKDFYAANTAKAFAEDDIRVAFSSEGTIGKLALVGADVEGICFDFTRRISG
ncbi:hypothetical protein [Sideroxydans lithotrophicus]|uniref:Uncharacterized protein n=1 Tax=Sideroxydans lithotrophicus (strain ES-1) TaxID=580332 RepID=D5CS08_SIDLE|nr:hypothetical protein [Sideroxydans lithotrophicus]ADE11744.1 conserved hypothetical protein [Sideroxydans lithotrophicus ES-1]